MIWYLFLIYVFAIIYFIFIGTMAKKKFYIFYGCLFLIVMGITIISTGLDYPNYHTETGTIITTTVDVNTTLDTYDINHSTIYTNVTDSGIKWMLGIIPLLFGTFISFWILFKEDYDWI